VPVKHRADGVKNIIAPHHLDGREVACAFWNRGFYHVFFYFQTIGKDTFFLGAAAFLPQSIDNGFGKKAEKPTSAGMPTLLIRRRRILL
jgi:hypothetical protein